MAADTQKPAATPSLQKLLSLEQDFTSFDEQLFQAAQIVGLQEVLTGSDGSPHRATRKERFHSRLEWVLRWLLEKLKAQDEAGHTARASVRAWKLLSGLLHTVPTSSAAKLLSGCQFLSVLERALLENFAEDARSGWVADQVDQDVAAPIRRESTSGSSATLGEQPRPSKKRKRHNGSPKEPVTTKPTTRSMESVTELFESIAVVVETIHERSSPSNQDDNGAVASAHMRAVLRTDTAQAALILKLWIVALYNMIRSFAQAENPLGGLKGRALCLSTVVRIWEMRSLNLDDESGISAAVFSSECLVPVTQLLSAIAHSSKGVDSQPALMKDKEGSIRQLEQLLARHVFIPSRTAYFAASQVRTSTAQTARQDFPNDTLRELLQPIKSYIVASAPDDHSGAKEGEQKPENAFGAIPLLLDVAIRCSPNLTIKRKHTEAPWINQVFTVLMDCTCATKPEAPNSSLAQMQAQTLESLLDIIIKRKMSLNENVLKTVIDGHSGNLHASDVTGEVRWSLIAKVVDLDPDIFIDRRKPSRTDRDDMSVPTVTTGLADVVSRMDFPSDAQEFSRDIPWRIVIDSVLMPLMRAYARNRNLVSFLTVWQVQLEHQLSMWLADVEEQNVSNRPPVPGRRPVIWEDSELIKALRPLLETSLTSKQIAEELTSYGSSIHELRESIEEDDEIAMIGDGKSSTSSSSESFLNGPPRKLSLDCLPSGKRHLWASAAASHVVLDAMLGAIHSDSLIEELLPQLQSLFTDLSVLAANEKVNCCELLPGIWRLLGRLHELMLPFLEESALEAHREIVWHAQGQLPLVDAALESFQSPLISEERYESLGRYEDSIRHEAFAFLVTMVHNFGARSNLRVRESEVLDAAISGLFGHAVPLGRLLYDAMKNEASDEAKVYAKHAAFILNVVPVFVRSPDVLQRLSSERRHELFRLLYWCALGERSSPLISTQVKTYAAPFSAFDAMLDAICTTAPSAVRDDLFQILLEGLSAEDTWGGNKNLAWDVIGFSEQCIHQIPLAAMGRKYREAVLDKVLEIAKGTMGERRPTELAKHFSVMLKLMEVPNATAQLCVDPEALVLLASTLSDDDMTQEPALAELLEALVQQTLQHVMATKEQERSKQYLDGLRARLSSQIKKGGFPTGRPGVDILFRQAVSFLAGDNMESSKEKLTEELLSALQSRLSEQQHKRENEEPFVGHEFKALLGAVIELLGAIVDQHDPPSPLETAWNEYAKIVLSSAETPQLDFENSTRVLVHQLAGMRHLQDHLQSYVDLTRSILRGDLSARDYRKVVRNFQDALQQIDAEQQRFVVSELQHSEDQQIPSPESLELIHSVIRLSKRLSLKSSEDAERSQEATPSQTDGSLFISLCALLPKLPDIRRFHLLAECTTTVLQEKPWLITQYAVDTLLASLTVLSSPSAPSLPTEHASVIYLPLCSITHCLISLHRTKLGGRFHILMPLLQALLSCLYIPESRHSTALPLPPWLDSRRPLLGQKHATAYARLLTTLCSPTVSSVSRKRKHGDAALTDETKKARAYAGQYVPLVLMQYCSLQLRGKVAEGVRERLQPGLWAAMDVVGLEGMRAMSAGMDGPGRAVWRGLYGEWNRFGRWKER
ncbi:hypothetical protein H2201_004160 [Coniosporium apollinis]|uniref:Nucleolar 27S pre-rRNA processing Urb2/Npa2 C-terminal domain-containing protein n=1 Tax=Coniosporium apollinis TaxID=61459 RepID=A0ABQ9NXC1_9PEZI|nr:hypothetical protein H2201_004160 [Coniosporium apollinis]